MRQDSAASPAPFSRTAQQPVPPPPFRRLRGYAFDPSLSTQLDTAFVNEVVFRVPWEVTRSQSSSRGRRTTRTPSLLPGPVGEYIEVVDYDPSSSCFYEPVDLSDPIILAQDGLDPSEGNPQFHQQMVYAVAMTTVRNFERALGRWVLWSPRQGPGGPDGKEQFVQRLRIYPHALREANAYYSPDRKALLFGYFPAQGGNGTGFPGGMVFTCLSHDIVAHETTHALLDGMHRRFIEPTNPDVLAFHEAFADLVALFQHFTFPEVLRHQIAKTRGDLRAENLLGELAQQFGQAIGHYGSLRSALGEHNRRTGVWEPLRPDPHAYQTVLEPHARGALLVAAVFDAFLAIYRRRTSDLLRLATAGSGVLPAGDIHPDLVGRLADEAAKSAQHVMNMCVRALDYCPPVDITFGDFLRAVITADFDLVKNDDLGYRIAFIEAFRRRGIYPPEIQTLSEDSLRWDCDPDNGHPVRVSLLAELLRHLRTQFEYPRDREHYFKTARELRGWLSAALRGNVVDKKVLARVTKLLLHESQNAPGLTRTRKGGPSFEVHGLWPVRRVGPDMDSLDQIVISITQRRILRAETLEPATRKDLENDRTGQVFAFRGGVTLVVNLQTLELQYVIPKDICDDERLARTQTFNGHQLGATLRGTYLSDVGFDRTAEPLAVLHRLTDEGEPSSNGREP